MPGTTLPASIDKEIKPAVKKNHPTELPVKQFILPKHFED